MPVNILFKNSVSGHALKHYGDIGLLIDSTSQKGNFTVVITFYLVPRMYYYYITITAARVAKSLKNLGQRQYPLSHPNIYNLHAVNKR